MKIALYLTDTKNLHDGVTKFLQETLKAYRGGNADTNVRMIGGALLARKEDPQKIAAVYDEIAPGVSVKLTKTAYPAIVLSRAEYLLKRNYIKKCIKIR